MSLRPLPTTWNLYNLRGSPYFQGALEQADGSARPLDLFVGRGTELHQLRTKVHGAAESSTRQAIAGATGIGKTTLVQQLKAELLSDGFFTTDEHVQLLPRDDAAALFGRALAAVYDTILVNRPHTVDSPSMREAELLVRVTKLGTGGASFSALGFGAGVNKGTTISIPKDILLDGPRILRDLLRLVRESDGYGVVLHLNNLENLSESEAAAAADVLRSLRDLLFMHDGLHTIVVGTTEAVSLAVNQHPQVRSVFDTLNLEPLSIEDVHKLLVERYRYLQLNDAADVIAPVTPETVEALYTVYRGDLRGLLKALDDGVSQLIGLRMPSSGAKATPGAERPVEPLPLDAVSQALRRRYTADLEALPEQNRCEQLKAWGLAGPTAIQTQKSLGELWDVTQGAVSQALRYLIANGLVVQLPRRDREIQYALSGTSRLIFGAPASESG